MKRRKKIVLVVGEGKQEVYGQLISMLKEKFFVQELYAAGEKPGFFAVRMVSFARAFSLLARKLNPDIILVLGGPLISSWTAVFLVRFLGMKKKIIVYRHDIEHFRYFPRSPRYWLGHISALMLERFCLTGADSIIHKGLGEELKFLGFYGRIRDKPHFLFRNFLRPDYAVKKPKAKLSSVDGEFHLAYAGSIYTESTPFADSLWEFYPKVTSQKIHFHLYSDASPMIRERLLEASRKDPYFHYEGSLPHKRLIAELSKYDYGTTMDGWYRKPGRKSYFLMTTFGNKTFDYMGARIPVICSRDMKATADFINAHGIGFDIDCSNISELKAVLSGKRKHYGSMVRNIDKAIARLSSGSKFLRFVGS